MISPGPSPRRILRQTALSAAFLGALATHGRAATYCIDLGGGACDVTSSGAAGLQTALNAAAGTAANDTVRVGAGTYLGPFTYAPAGDAGTLAIVGSGPEQTTLSVPVPGSLANAVLAVARDAVGHPATVSRLAVVVPSTAAAGIHTDGLVEDARVTAIPGSGGPLGIWLRGTGSGIRRCEIDMNGVPQATGLETGAATTFSPDPAPAFLEDSSVLNGLVTIEAFAPLRISRCRVSARGNSAVRARGTQVTVDDTLVLAESASALAAGSESGPRAGQILARHVTLVSIGPSPAFAGIDVDAFEANATADVRHAIIRGFQYSTFRRAGASVAATVALSASNFPAGAHRVQGAGTTTLSEPHPNIDADPLFTDPLTGDYSLRTGSPAIDATYSPPLAADESPVDLVGAMRIQDGNGDGVAARDMGAFEHPAVAVTTTSTTSPIPTISTTTTSTTVPCETPRCLFDGAVGSPACGGVVPRATRTRIEAVVRLTDRLGTSSGRQRRRLVQRARGKLGALGMSARRAAKGKKPRIATACATALADAAATVGRQVR